MPLFIAEADDRELVIASDNAGAIGPKPDDAVQVPYEVVAQALFRVAIMDTLAVGASPFAVNLMNFAGEEAWNELEKTIISQCRRLGIEMGITGSTESNFSMNQSAVGLTVIGKVMKADKKIGCSPQGCGLALIGEPLVGEEVIQCADRAAPLELFAEMTQQEWVYELVPVGSKGIDGSLREWERRNGREQRKWEVPFDCSKSGGPSTSFLVSYDLNCDLDLIKMAEAFVTVIR
nr:AIR synthase related protein [Halobacillus sp. A5]